MIPLIINFVDFMIFMTKWRRMGLNGRMWTRMKRATK